MKYRVSDLCAVGLLFCAGCAEGPQGVPVRGKVVDGASPVTTGMLIMTPVTEGPKVTVPLDSTGSFDLSAEEGPAAGDYIVSLQSEDPLANSRSPGGPEMAAGGNGATGDQMTLSAAAPKSWPVTFHDQENSITLDLQVAQ